MKFFENFVFLSVITMFTDAKMIQTPFNRMNQISHSLYGRQSQDAVKNCKLYITEIEPQSFKETLFNNETIRKINYLKYKCTLLIREYNFKINEEKRQRRMKLRQNKENEIYRNHLVVTQGSSVLKDFFAMRY
jgi:hypothetical protein